MPPIRVGMIGTGTIANSHATSLQGHANGQIVAVFDVLGDRAADYAKKWNIPTVAKSLDELLAMKDVDAVIVATPPFAHAEPTMKALQAGKHVLCEKPFALDPAEAERMVRTADSVGKYLACASARNRTTQSARAAHAMIERGELGEVYHVRSSRWRFRGRPGHHIFKESAWFLDKKRAGGGAVMDIAVYNIDEVLWMLGNPKVTSVLAQMRQFKDEEPTPAGITQDVEDHIVLMMACEGGKSGIVETAWVSNMRGADAFLIFGTKASLRFDPLVKITAAPPPPDQPRTSFMGEGQMVAVEQQVLLYEGSPFGGPGVTGAFVDSLARGEQPMTPGKDALEVTRVIDAAYRSVRTGAAVALV